MSSVWPQLISAAVVGIISPMAIMAAIALLASRRPITNVFAFLAGWNLVLAVPGRADQVLGRLRTWLSKHVTRFRRPHAYRGLTGGRSEA